VVLSKVEQRLDAVRAVLAGCQVSEVAVVLGGILHVNRQTYPGRGGLSPRRPRAGGGEPCRSSNRFARSGIVSPAAKDQATGSSLAPRVAWIGRPRD
jgi:hypothetical protein